MFVILLALIGVAVPNALSGNRYLLVDLMDLIVQNNNNRVPRGSWLLKDVLQSVGIEETDAEVGTCSFSGFRGDSLCTLSAQFISLYNACNGEQRVQCLEDLNRAAKSLEVMASSSECHGGTNDCEGINAAQKILLAFARYVGGQETA